jgi:hypothetical protein
MSKFDSHSRAKYWSSKNLVKPCDVALNSHKKFWFDCDCGHEFNIALNCLNRGGWCQFCANKKICDYSQNCKICFDKSFASVEYSQNWSDKNKELPKELFKNSHKEYLFD